MADLGYRPVWPVWPVWLGPWTHPGIPPDSMLLARVTSLDQASNCHFLLPRTPANRVPEWMPTRMSKEETPVSLRTLLKKQKRTKLTKTTRSILPCCHPQPSPGRLRSCACWRGQGTYAMWVIMSRPMLTAHCACLGLSSSPEMQ